MSDEIRGHVKYFFYDRKFGAVQVEGVGSVRFEMSTLQRPEFEAKSERLVYKDVAPPIKLPHLGDQVLIRWEQDRGEYKASWWTYADWWERAEKAHQAYLEISGSSVDGESKKIGLQAIVELRQCLENCRVKIQVVSDPSITTIHYWVFDGDKEIFTASDYGEGRIDESDGDSDLLPLIEACQDCLNDLLEKLGFDRGGGEGSEIPDEEGDEDTYEEDGSCDEYVLAGMDLLNILERIYQAGGADSQQPF